MVNETDLPDTAKLMAERNAIVRQIDTLTVRRDKLEALISAMQAFEGKSKLPGTYEMVDMFFEQLPFGESGTTEDILKFARKVGWRSTSRSRIGAIRSALSRKVSDGKLAKTNRGNPARYARSDKISQKDLENG
jgi:hypothetical protein